MLKPEYHGFHVQGDTLWLAYICENFRNMCLEMYGLDSASFLTAWGLSWQAAFEKTKVKLNLLTDISMLLLVEKCIRKGICNTIHQYAKANNNYMKDYEK